MRFSTMSEIEISMTRSRLHSRQNLLVADAEDTSVAVLGIGSIGSNAVDMALSLGIQHITMYDPDMVELENVWPARLGMGGIGLPKVLAVQEAALRDYGVVVEAHQQRVDSKSSFDGRAFDVIISGFDSVHARREFWEWCIAQPERWRYYIDGRMGQHTAKVWTVTSGDREIIDAYEYDLHGNFIAGPMACGMKATAPLTKGFIPGMIGQSLVDILNGNQPPMVQWYALGGQHFIVRSSSDVTKALV